MGMVPMSSCIGCRSFKPAGLNDLRWIHCRWNVCFEMCALAPHTWLIVIFDTLRLGFGFSFWWKVISILPETQRYLAIQIYVIVTDLGCIQRTGSHCTSLYSIEVLLILFFWSYIVSTCLFIFQHHRSPHLRYRLHYFLCCMDKVLCAALDFFQVLPINI